MGDDWHLNRFRHLLFLRAGLASTMIPAAGGEEALSLHTDISLVEQVFQEYAPHVYHLARQRLNDECAAEGVAAEVLLRVVQQPCLASCLNRLTEDAVQSTKPGNSFD